jgi:hypothetical protein
LPRGVSVAPLSSFWLTISASVVRVKVPLRSFAALSPPPHSSHVSHRGRIAGIAERGCLHPHLAVGAHFHREERDDGLRVDVEREQEAVVEPAADPVVDAELVVADHFDGAEALFLGKRLGNLARLRHCRFLLLGG